MMRARSKFSPAQCRAARALLGWSQEDLAQRAHVELETVQLYEAELAVLRISELIVLGTALNDGGAIALPTGWAGEGVRFSHAPSRPAARARVDVDGPFDLTDDDEEPAPRSYYGR